MAPPAMASKGDIPIDQAERGYDVASEAEGQLMWYNLFKMKYVPHKEGNINGETGHGHISFARFADTGTSWKDGRVSLEELDRRGLPTLRKTTSIFAASRKSLQKVEG